MKHPDVVIIFIPSDGSVANLIGARRNGREWQYSKPAFIPANEVWGFIAEELTPRGCWFSTAVNQHAYRIRVWRQQCRL